MNLYVADITRLGRMAWGMVLGMFLVGMPGGAVELRDFHHRAWTSENGLGAVRYLHQAPDGFLWLTTTKGIFRFDGVRFEPIDQASHGLVRNKDLDSAYPARPGGLWLSTQRQGMLRWDEQGVKAFADRRCTPSRGGGRVVEGKDGSLWVRSSAGLGHLRNGKCQILGPEAGYPGGFASDVFTDRRGTVWVKVPAGPVYYQVAGQERFVMSESGDGVVGDFAYFGEAPDGAVWLSDGEGLRAITDGRGVPLAAMKDARARRLGRFEAFTFAPDGTLWAGHASGVVRVAAGVVPKDGRPVDVREGAVFSTEKGLSADVIWALLVDREGTVWIGTNSGLDQLRPTALSRLDLPKRPEHQMVVAAGEKGAVWVGSRAMPVTRVEADGTRVEYPATRQAVALRRDRHGVIWSAGAGEHGLWRIEGGRLESVPYPTEKVELTAAVAVDRNDEVWISTVGPHVYHRLKSGEWKLMDGELGRKPGVFGAMSGDEAGNVWFAFSNKLLKWDGRGFERYAFAEGQMNISVAALGFREDRVWVAGMSGLLLFERGAFRKLRWKDEDLAGRMYAVMETPEGDLWMNASSGIVHVPAAEVLAWRKDASYAVTAERFDALDGLVGLNGDRVPDPTAIQAPDGRLWFATTKAVMWLDPAVLERNRNRLPPPVAVTAMVGDGVRYAAKAGLRLPVGVEKFEFDYTALSLSIPERVRFRYRLEGKDKDWNEAGARRQAFYNNLAPGWYRFRVMASNPDGVWNEAGAAVDFYLPPAFYQTSWFLALCVVVAGVGVWGIFRMRIRVVTRELEARLVVRLEERERIARELHDTLLQSLLGLMLRFQFAADQLPEGSQPRVALTEALDQAEQVMTEGRERVKDLRSRSGEGLELEAEVRRVGETLCGLGAAGFRVEACGEARRLREDLQEELLLVVREALMNANRHSGAAEIQVRVEYGRGRLVVGIRDDGRGIDLDVLVQGRRENHWGLPGMRERMRKLGGEFAVELPEGGGTRVVLTVPGPIAYCPAEGEEKGGHWGRMVRRLVGA